MNNISVPLERFGIKSLNKNNCLRLSKCNELPTHSGVYIFWLNDRPIYIGKASNIRGRIMCHLYSGTLCEYLNKFRWIKVFWIKNDTREVLLIEKILVKYFKPILNKQLI